MIRVEADRTVLHALITIVIVPEPSDCIICTRVTLVVFRAKARETLLIAREAGAVHHEFSLLAFGDTQGFTAEETLSTDFTLIRARTSTSQAGVVA